MKTSATHPYSNFPQVPPPRLPLHRFLFFGVDQAHIHALHRTELHKLLKKILGSHSLQSQIYIHPHVGVLQEFIREMFYL